MKEKKKKLNQEEITKMEQVLSRGKDIEVRTNKDGTIKILEISKKTV